MACNSPAINAMSKDMQLDPIRHVQTSYTSSFEIFRDSEVTVKAYPYIHRGQHTAVICMKQTVSRLLSCMCICNHTLSLWSMSHECLLGQTGVSCHTRLLIMGHACLLDQLTAALDVAGQWQASLGDLPYLTITSLHKVSCTYALSKKRS